MFQKKKDLYKKNLFISVFLLLGLVIITFLIVKQTSNTSDKQYINKTTSASSKQLPYKLGIYYFGVWSNKNKTKVHNDFWIGVKEFYNGQNPWNEDFSYLKPAIGYYNDSQVETLEKHINQAKSHGVSYFNFYWYWDHYNKKPINDSGLNSYLIAKNRDDLEFMISIVAHPGDETFNIDANDAQEVANIMVDYFEYPNYLRTKNGRPILNIIDNQGFVASNKSSTQKTEDFIALIKQKTIKRKQQNPHSLVKLPYIMINSSVPKAKYLEQIDGYTCLNHFGLSLQNRNGILGTMKKYNRLFVKRFDYFNNKPYTPCFMADFDSRPRMYTTGKPYNKFPYITDWDYDTNYTQGLQLLKNYVDNQKTKNAETGGYVNFYAWNEWREGGNTLEPCEKYGDRMLQKIVDVFNLSSHLPPYNSLCKTLGYCMQDFYHPSGTLDRADVTKLSGWARDADTSVPLIIHIYKNKPYYKGGEFVVAVKADKLRADLPFIDKYHGFSFKTPDSLKKGDRIYAYALGINGNGDLTGDNHPLNGSGMTIK